MNSQLPTPEQPELSTHELRELIRGSESGLTRRQIRMRDRAVQAGQLLWVGNRLVIAQEHEESQASEQGEPAPITSADVLAGKVPATTGLTRRELRALAQEQESADIPVVTPEPEVAPKAEKEPEPEVEQTLALRPVVRPKGAQAGEYSGQYEDIRTGHTRQIPVQQPTPVEPPQRKSIFETQVDTSFEDDLPEEDSSISDTSAAGLPVFDESYEPEEIPVTDPPPAPVEKLQESEEVESSPPSVPRPGDDTYNFPDWHTLTDIPAIAPRSAQTPTRSETKQQPSTKRVSTPLWLTILQWCVITVVAIVLGLLVWYAINKGFGETDALRMGIFQPLYYLRI